MATQEKAIAGGLLSGVGQGLIARGQAQREEAAAMREAALERAKERRERRFKREERQADREHQRGLLSRTVTGDDGKVYGVTRGGEAKDLGITQATDGSGASGGGASGGGASGGGLSVDDKRLIDAVIKRHTSGKGSIEGERTDWAAVIESLKREGRDDLARLYQATEGATDRIDVGSQEWNEAVAQAESEANDRNPTGPDFLRGGAVEEAYGGMTQSEWTNQRAQELYRQYTGASGGQGRSGLSDRQGGSRDRSQAGGEQGRPSPGGAGAQHGQRGDQYDSAEAVREAYRSGDLSREQAMEILRNQFGYQ